LTMQFFETLFFVEDGNDNGKHVGLLGAVSPG